MQPECIIHINGALASSALTSRLVSCTVTDKEGIGSDSARIVLNNDPAAAIPPTGAEVKIWMGYADLGLAFLGTFLVDEVEVKLFPHMMHISASAADLRETIKENKERHWDDANIEQIVGDIAGDHGLRAKVDGLFAGRKYEWIGQQDESDMSFLRRLETRHGGLFSVKDGMLIFAQKGSGQTPTGKALTPFVVGVDNLVEGSGTIKFSDRPRYEDVKAYHQDRDKVERVEVSAASSDGGTATYRLGEPFASVDEAQNAAQAKAKDLQRQAASFSCTIVGNPNARAGAPLQFSGMRAGIDGERFIIGSATHEFSKSGYTTKLSGEKQV